MESIHEQAGSKKFDKEKSPIREAYLALNAETPLELSNLYTKEDQKLFRSGGWDYNDSGSIINKIKNILENVNAEHLTEDEKNWRQEILWFWYHHAISCAIGLYKDKEKAKEYAAKALELQPDDHPNKITRLLDLLVNDKLPEAEKFAETITEEPEKTTAADTIREFKEKGFF